MFDFNLMKITAEHIQSGRMLSEALDMAEARRIYSKNGPIYLSV